jgi:methylated-DNA-[protein]-cysteine S-methyltransferase
MLMLCEVEKSREKRMDYDLIYFAPCTALGINLTEKALTHITFLPGFDASLLQISPRTDALAKNVIRQLDIYFQDPSYQFDLPIKLSGTPYQQAVWQAIAAIPQGQVLSYGTIASTLRSGSRAVGNACGRNPLPIVIPCHRVVGKQGLGGFNRDKTGAMLNIKRWLLTHEGID